MKFPLVWVGTRRSLPERNWSSSSYPNVASGLHGFVIVLAVMDDEKCFDLRETYVQFDDGGSAETIVVTERFWPDVMSGKIALSGRLITAAHMTEDWPHWEMHPEGEELVVLLRGSVELVVEREGRELRQTLQRPGEAWLNRRGDWHRAIIHEPSDLLFITHGQGTQHRPVVR